MEKVLFRLRVARAVLKSWPFGRGRYKIQHLLLGGFTDWPDSADIDFKFGRFINASLRPWPYGYRDLYLRGLMEELETRAWRSVLRRGDRVFDGGANWGYYTLLASKLVGAEGQVFAFEPVPATAAALRRNVDASGCRNVRVIEAGLAASAGSVTLNLFAEDPTGLQTSVSRQEALTVVASVQCETLSLDEFGVEHARPTLVKLDVEGCELPALQGAAHLLRSEAAPIITFEWNETTAKGAGYHPQAIVAFLAGFGYECYLAVPQGFAPFAVRTDITDWSPMVWAFRPGLAEHAERLGKTRFVG